MRFLALAAVLWVALFLSGCTIPAASIAPENCAATIVNGGFEDGVFGWTVSGFVQGDGWSTTAATPISQSGSYAVPGSTTGLKVSAFEGDRFLLASFGGSKWSNSGGCFASQSFSVQPGATYEISAHGWRNMGADSMKLTISDAATKIQLAALDYSGGSDAQAELWTEKSATFAPSTNSVKVCATWARQWGWGGAATPQMVFALDDIEVEKIAVRDSDLSCVSCEGSGSRCVDGVVWRCDGAVFQRFASCGGNGCDVAGVACFVPVATPAPTPTPNLAVSPSPYVSPSTTPGTTGNNGGASDVIGWLFANPLWLFGIIGLLLVLFSLDKKGR